MTISGEVGVGVAKRKVITRTAKKRTAKSVSKKSQGGTEATRKKKTTAKPKPKTTKRVVRAKAAAKKVAKKATKKVAKKVAKKVTKRATKKATKKVKPAAKATPKSAKIAGKKTAKIDASPPPSTRISLQWGSTTIELVEEGEKVPKTTLTRKELREFRDMLLAKRRELVGDMENLGNEARNSKNGGGGSSNVPLHMADVGSDNWEQEFTLGLIENERTLVREIDSAIERVQTRTYGVCLATHTPINKARLRAKPWAKYCIEYARLRELGRVP